MDTILKNKFYKNYLPIFILLLGIALCFYTILHLEKKQSIKNIDKKLLLAAKDIKYIIGQDYIKSDINAKTYSKKTVLEKATLLNKMADDLEVDYLYVLVKKGNDIHYAVMSAELDSLQAHPSAYYWYSFKEAEDNSFDLTWKSFDSKDPVFLRSTDIWGSYRSVYLPEVSKDGTLYIAGADIKTSSLRKHMSRHTVVLLLNTGAILLFAIPLILSFKKLKVESTVFRKKSVHLEWLDPLTGAYNRKKGLEILRNFRESIGLGDTPISICMLDIQNLGYINKTRGLQAGDEIVKIVVNVLLQSFRKSDKVVRLEGDKLMVILQNCSSESKNILIKKLKNRLSSFNKFNKKDYFIEVYTIFAEYKGEEVDSFINESLNRLALNKKNKNISDSIIQDELLLGISRNELKTFFQPKIFSENKKVEFEALVRWFHPEKGIVSPDKFIPIAEKSFLIHKITELVLKDSLDAAKKLNARVSVNISATVFESDTFVSDIENILNSSEYRNLITLEITESTAMSHSESTLKKMNQLIDLGIKFSIDDFGTGYSSLSYLGKFPISELKIDRFFVNDMDSNKITPLIIRFITQLGHIAGFKVIAEGVETEEQVQALMSLGCFNFQGYYFDKPQPIDVILENHIMSSYISKIKFMHKN